METAWSSTLGKQGARTLKQDARTFIMHLVVVCHLLT